jgi:hypothetical protein
MEAGECPETGVFYGPEGGTLNNHRCENLKSYTNNLVWHIDPLLGNNRETRQRPLPGNSFVNTQKNWSRCKAAARA